MVERHPFVQTRSLYQSLFKNFVVLDCSLHYKMKKCSTMMRYICVLFLPFNRTSSFTSVGLIEVCRTHERIEKLKLTSQNVLKKDFLGFRQLLLHCLSQFKNKYMETPNKIS